MKPLPHKQSYSNLLLALTALGLSLGSASAAITVSSHVDGTAGISTSGLLRDVTPSAGRMDGSNAYVATEASLTNGLVGPPNAQMNWVNASRTFAGSGGVQGFLEYDLDISTNTAGYDISSLAIYTGSFGTAWNRVVVEVFTQTVGGSFVSAGTVDSNNTTAASSTLTIGNFGTAGQGIEAIRLEFGRVGTDYMLSDIDLFGVAAPIPEPSAALLGGLGLLALLRRRR